MSFLPSWLPVRRIAAIVLMSLLPSTVAPAQETYVVFDEDPSRFPLSTNGISAPIVVHEFDHAGVIRAARDLQRDVERVTGASPPFANTAPEGEGAVVLVGTIGTSPLIDRLVTEGRLSAAGLAGRWESFVVQTVDQPLPGVARALVIAGSDKRGTIFGIYDLAEKIGVSPWHFWADVPPAQHDALYVVPGRYSQSEPAVRYRGIFINDEAPALAGWAHETFGGFNADFYAHVFELILRMKGNFLWPAMWGRAIYDDDPRSPELADEYGVVIGTSHHEPMMRAHVEWERYGSGAWNYETNPDPLRAFWREGIERMGDNESLVTVGMRGDGDEPMTEGTAIALLERIVQDQRDIIEDVTGEPAEKTQQVWALYKEVQDYYDNGMDVPDDVTLLFADDNWGNIRRLPELGADRPGGYGVYYHYDYVGGPRNYKWINTNQISRIWEQMNLAYHYGATRIWIVNVGDIKPMELPTQFFLDFAWDPNRWPAARLPEYTRQWAEQQFGSEYAPEIAELLTAYTTYNSRRKPELLDPDTYSITDFREAETVRDEYNALAEKSRVIFQSIPPEYQDAYFQLVQYPVEASANLNDLYVTVARNRLYAEQGRAGANDLAARARDLFARDAELARIHHEDIAGGKWNHMMSQTHIGYTYWQQPEEQTMPSVEEIEAPERAEMGVAIEGSRLSWPGDDIAATLPILSPYGPRSRYVEVFNRGRTPFEFRVEPSQPWLQATPASGRIDRQERIEIKVNWEAAPPGSTRVPITIHGPDGAQIVVYADVVNPDNVNPETDDVHGFVESGGFVSIEAAHYSRAVDAPPLFWNEIPDLGRTFSGMTTFPVTAPPNEAGEGPYLEYPIYLFSEGEIEIEAILSPSLDFRGGGGLRYAVSIDDESPQVVNMHPDDSNAFWERTVANNANRSVSRAIVSSPGRHVLKFWRIDPGVVVQKLVIRTADVPPSYLGPPESVLRLD